jgi:hypothetical protein
MTVKIFIFLDVMIFSPGKILPTFRRTVLVLPSGPKIKPLEATRRYLAAYFLLALTPCSRKYLDRHIIAQIFSKFFFIL